MKNYKRKHLSIAIAAMLGAYAASSVAHAETTLEAVKKRGHVTCGASQGTVGFGAPDDKGYWRGLDVDTCRAVAVALFNDREKVEFVPLSGQQRIPALQTGEIDILPRTLTWTLRGMRWQRHRCRYRAMLFPLSVAYIFHSVVSTFHGFNWKEAWPSSFPV